MTFSKSPGSLLSPRGPLVPSFRFANPAALALVVVAFAFGCTENKYYSETTNIYRSDPDGGAPKPDPGSPDVDAGAPGDEDAGTSEPVTEDAGTSEPVTEDAGSSEPDAGGPDPDAELLVGAPKPNTLEQDLDVDVFGEWGNRYWFAVTTEQLERMNGDQFGGPVFIDKLPGGFFPGDIYTPGGQADATTFANRLFVTKAGKTPKTADFGKVEVRVVGQSTRRPWTTGSIPNLRLDTNEYEKARKINGVEHLRFNNGLVGSIFREKLTLDIFKAFKYPAPRATFAWVSSNVWGPDVSIPYTLVEVYKKQFCADQGEAWGGGCANMWEFVGDVSEAAQSQENCQLKTCDNGRIKQFAQVVQETPLGDGFKAALADWLDWDSFHQFQCLSWMLWIGDDALHNQNNVVIAERDDGKFQYLPYSVDISLGQDWYQQVPLYGQNSIARGCQSDAACWTDTIHTCEQSIAKFKKMNPVKMAEELNAKLQAQGMLRSGDDDRYEQLKGWLETRTETLSDELEGFRELPVYCEYPYYACDNTCIPVDQPCDLCEEPVPVEGDAGAPVDDGEVVDPPGKPVVGLGNIDVGEPMPVPWPIPEPPVCQPGGGKPGLGRPIDVIPFDAYRLKQ